MSKLVERLQGIVGHEHVSSGGQIESDDTHDEALTGARVEPLAVVRPDSTEQVRDVVVAASAAGVPVVARGSGTGLSGGCRPAADGILVAFDRMDRILEIDLANQVAIVQSGVTLAQLDDALVGTGLIYPVYPGEMSASLGGNVGTNAGGMRAIRYGVTRHNVLGLEAVLADGTVIHTGGRFVKSSSGYDLTQLIIGSEGTLALVTQVTVKLVGRLAHAGTLLAPFGSLEQVSAAVPVMTSGVVTPLILEYIDAAAMIGIAGAAEFDLGVPDAVHSVTYAYLVVVLESAHEDRLEADVESVAATLRSAGALEVYFLPPAAGRKLIAARERAFFVAKAAGANDIVDMVVPRAAIPQFMSEVARLSSESSSFVSACGHVGDGNVHLSVFQPDDQRRSTLVQAILQSATSAGGAVSGEHGIGIEKRKYFAEFEDPAKLALMRRIKAAFDPQGLLGPGRLFEDAARSD